MSLWPAVLLLLCFLIKNNKFVSLCLWENKRRQMPKAPSFRFYFHFLLIVRLMIKMFTSINPALSFQCANPGENACLCDIGSPSWYKTEIFPALRRNHLPHLPYRKCTEPWHHCVVSNRTVNFVNCYTPNIYIYIYIQWCEKKCLCCPIFVFFAYLSHLNYSDHKTFFILHKDNPSKYKMQFWNNFFIY